MNVLKNKLSNNELTIGAWIQLPCVAIAEIFAANDFDWVCIDMQHGIINMETAANMITAIERYGKVPVIRLPSLGFDQMCLFLDMGARGIIIPDVRTYHDVKSVISKLRFPPEGYRSFGYYKSNLYGKYFDNYTAHANLDIAIIVQVEHIDALNNINQILSLHEVDGSMIGPLDLSGSAEISLNDPLFKNLIDKYVKACDDHNQSAGTHIVDIKTYNDIQNKIKCGYKLLAIGTDGLMLNTMSGRICNYVSENF